MGPSEFGDEILPGWPVEAMLEHFKPIQMGEHEWYQFYTGASGIEHAGIFFIHAFGDGFGRACIGSVPFVGRNPGEQRAVWQVESEDPLTISPSVLCRGEFCRNANGSEKHGFIRGGKWVEA